MHRRDALQAIFRKLFADVPAKYVWINPNSLSKCFTFQHISTMSLSRVFFCCWCILVYLVYYLNLSESSQFVHGLLLAPAVRPPLQLEHRPLPVSHNKISQIMSPWRKSPRNHQSQRTAPLLPSGVTGPVNSTLERRWKNPSHSWEKCQTLSLCGFPSFAFAILQSFPNWSLRLQVAALKNGPGNQAKKMALRLYVSMSFEPHSFSFSCFISVSMSCHLTESHLV